jgi:catechol 2,3-dioxygenase-like lactoylglutathione lyase family enzyme
VNFNHVGYVVDDLEAAIARFGSVAGPFITVAHMEFDEVTYRGGPAEYDHSSAFGKCGDFILELTQVHHVAPEGLAREFGRRHIGILADDQAATVEQLGLEVFHTGKTGPASAVWMLGGDLFPHPVEVLQSAPPLVEFYERIRAA